MNLISRRKFLLFLLIYGFLGNQQTFAKLSKVKEFDQLDIINWPQGYTLDYYFTLSKNISLSFSSTGQIALFKLIIDKVSTCSIINENNSLFSKIHFVKQLKSDEFAVFGQKPQNSKYYLTLIKIKNKSFHILSSLELNLSALAQENFIDITSNYLAVSGLDNQAQSIVYFINLNFLNNLNNIENSYVKLNKPIDCLQIINNRIFAITDKTKLIIVEYKNNKITVDRDINIPGFYYNNKIDQNSLSYSYNFIASCKNYIFLACLDSGNKTNLTILNHNKKNQINLVNKIPINAKIKFIKILNNNILVLENQNNKSLLTKFTLSGSKIQEIGLNSPILNAKEEDYNDLYLVKNNLVLCSSNLGVINVSLNDNNTNNFNYTQIIYNPRTIPVTAMAVNENTIILGSTELKFFEINTKKKNLILRKSMELKSPAQDTYILDKNNYLICDANSLNICNIADPKQVSQVYPNSFEKLVYDRIGQVYYGLSNNLSKAHYSITLITYKNGILTFLPPQDLPTPDSSKYIIKMVCHGGYVILASLHNLHVYGLSEGLQYLHTYTLEKFAIRDFTFNSTNIFISCIDEDLKSYLKIINKDSQNFDQVNNITLPHDGQSVYLYKDYLLTSGKDSNGKDLLAIYNINNISDIKLIKVMPTIPYANKIIDYNDEIYVAGLGIQVISGKI